MRWTRWFALSLALTVTAAAAVALAGSTAAPGKSAKAAAHGSVERGRYLVSVIGCGDCHTPGTFWGAPDMTRFLSGSEMAWAGPGGAVYAANLTPDPETGLGKWTAEQIVTTFRTGNRPDGRQLSPAMPWMNFSRLTDEDAYSIAAYLKSLPPVAHQVPAPIAAGAEIKGPVLNFPPPSEWDARNLPKAPGAGGGQ